MADGREGGFVFEKEESECMRDKKRLIVFTRVCECDRARESERCTCTAHKHRLMKNIISKSPPLFIKNA